MEDNKTAPQLHIAHFSKAGMMTVAIPNEVITAKDPYVRFGKNNLAPQEYCTLYNQASYLHKKLIDLKADMIASKGFKEVDALKDFIDNVDCEETLNEIALDIAKDYVMSNYFVLRVIWTAAKKIGYVERIPFENMRIAKPTCVEDAGKIKGFYLNADWANKKSSHHYFPAFDPEKYLECPEQIIYVRKKTPGMFYYTLPYYSPGLTWLRLSEAIGTFALANIKNGMFPNIIITNRTGANPTPEQMQAEYDMVNAKFRGEKAASDSFMLWANAGQEPTITTLNANDNDKKFNDILKYIEEATIRMHGFTSSVAGLDVAGKLSSGRNEIIDNVEMIVTKEIKPVQKLIERTFNKLAKINGLPEMELEDFTMFEPVDETKLATTDDLLKITDAYASKKLPYNSAMAMMKQLFGYDDEISRAILGPIPVIVPEVPVLPQPTNVN
jgi:hypothetical protein